MVRRINRVLLAVRSLDKGRAAFQRALGLPAGSPYSVADVGAMSVALPIGDAWIQLLEPVDDGPVARFLAQHQQGIYGIGVEVASLADARLRVEQHGRQAHPLRLGDIELVCLKREQMPGLTVWLSETGLDVTPTDDTPFTGVWQVTNLVEDRDEAAAQYAGLFGLPEREENFRQDTYGYLGRTLYYGRGPGADSVELAQVHRPDTAMGRFWQRHGPSAYMVTLAAHDLAAVRRQLEGHHIQHSAEPIPPGNVVYVHPRELAGCFAGIVQT